MELSDTQKEYIMKRYPWSKERHYEKLAHYLKISLWKK